MTPGRAHRSWARSLLLAIQQKDKKVLRNIEAALITFYPLVKSLFSPGEPHAGYHCGNCGPCQGYDSQMPRSPGWGITLGRLVYRDGDPCGYPQIVLLQTHRNWQDEDETYERIVLRMVRHYTPIDNSGQRECTLTWEAQSDLRTYRTELIAALLELPRLLGERNSALSVEMAATEKLGP